MEIFSMLKPLLQAIASISNGPNYALVCVSKSEGYDSFSGSRE